MRFFWTEFRFIWQFGNFCVSFTDNINPNRSGSCLERRMDDANAKCTITLREYVNESSSGHHSPFQTGHRLATEQCASNAVDINAFCFSPFFRKKKKKILCCLLQLCAYAAEFIRYLFDLWGDKMAFVLFQLIFIYSDSRFFIQCAWAPKNDNYKTHDLYYEVDIWALLLLASCMRYIRQPAAEGEKNSLK